MTQAVSDTGPLLHLTEAGCFDLLKSIGDLHAPRQVIVEIADLSPGWQTPKWLTVDDLEAPHAIEAVAWVRAERALLDLASSSLWVTRSVLAEARSALDEIFRR